MKMNKLKRILQEIKGTDLEISAGKTFTYPSGGIGGNWGGSADMLIKLVTKASKKVSDNELNTSFSVNSEKRSTRETASEKVSDHYRCATASAAYDLATSGEPGWRCWDAILDAMVELGWSTEAELEAYREPKMGSYLNVQVGDYRIQPIWHMDKDHFDHVHVGIRNKQYPVEDMACDPGAASAKILKGFDKDKFITILTKGQLIIQTIVGIMDQLDPDVNRIPTAKKYNYQEIIRNVFKNYANTIWSDDNKGAANMLEKRADFLTKKLQTVNNEFTTFKKTITNTEIKELASTIYKKIVIQSYNNANPALRDIIQSIRNGDSDTITFSVYYYKVGAGIQSNDYTFTAPVLSEWKAKLKDIFG